MKCISLWQPWASLLVFGTKKIETRSWYTSYRGPLLIHASKRMVKWEMELLEKDESYIAAAIDDLSQRINYDDWMRRSLPFGALVGIVQMTNCLQVEEIASSFLDERHRADDYTWSERELGNYEPGRFGWRMERPKRFPNPIPYKGQQGFFDVDPKIMAEAWKR